MNKISDITRQDIIDLINNGFVECFDERQYDGETGEYSEEHKVYMPFYGRLDEISFFTRLYDLEQLPSHDNRYKDALGDISCHLRWGDYEEGWFFQDKRFKLLKNDGDEPLLRFMCEMLHPAVRKETSPWKQYLLKFNELLRPDGYELYAAQHISGRDIYSAREYVSDDFDLLPDNLFTERYKELVHYGNGKATDNISSAIGDKTKKRICKIIFEFDEPQRIQTSRYNNWTENTSAVREAVKRLNEFLDIPVISLDGMSMSYSIEEYLAAHFTPFIFDIIELQYDELSNGEKTPFQEKLNKTFQDENVSFRLSDRGLVELVVDHEVLSPEIIASIESIPEPGLKELLNEAVAKHMQPNLQAHRDAVEKVWDALERLKTFYASVDKRTSVEHIVNDMANGQKQYIELFNSEFKALTDIGNNYRIRHHETSKTDITDARYYDYFFNRCLSLIALAIQYL